MSLKEDIESQVKRILRESWSERGGTVVPESSDIGLGNDGVWLDAVVLYADMADSTQLVDNHGAKFAAEVYKCFLHSAAKIIRSEGGAITAYDGDRVMAVYIGNYKNTSAARTALKLNYAVKKIINPSIRIQYPRNDFELSHVVGVDASKLFVARTGIRGANDLVWVGRAANHAAKMASLDHSYASRITKEVYDAMHESARTSSDGRPMWEAVTWNDQSRSIYRSTWWWTL